MVKTASSIYPINCFSMNPSIAVSCLKGTGKSFVQNALDIRGVIGEETPFFLEAMGDTAEELVEDAKAMVKAVPGNTFVKIPACPEGFKAIRELKNAGIATSCTAVYTFNQAFVAHNIDCVVSAASLKTPLSLQEAIEAGADNVTVDLEMLEALAVHPMTEGTLKTFKSDWEGLFGEGVRIVDMVA